MDGDAELAIGIVGVGFLGTSIGSQFQDVDGVTVAAVADVDSENLAEAGEQFDVPPGSRYEGHAAMLDGEDLDALAVTTPHTLHYEAVVAGLDRGLHVYCEKPLVTSLEDAYDLAERDAENDLVLQVGYQRHLHPMFVRARERWAGQEDEPRFMTYEITQDLFGGLGDSWYADPELSGGGQIYSTGTHVIDALLWTTDLEPDSVTAQMDIEEGTERLDKHAALTVRFENGSVATLGISGETACNREHFHGWDGDGGLYVDVANWSESEMTLVHGDGSEESPDVDDEGPTKAQAFADAVREGTAPPATARDALRATAVQEAAYESHHSGEAVDVSISYPE